MLDCILNHFMFHAIITQFYKKTVALFENLDYNVFIDWGD